LGSILAIGLMSRATGEGVDAVAIETDGIAVQQMLGHYQVDYTPALRELLLSAASAVDVSDPNAVHPLADEAGHVLVQIYVEAVRQLISRNSLDRNMISVVGFLGCRLGEDTALHRAPMLGDPALLSAGIDVPVASGFSPTSEAAVSVEALALGAAKKLMRLAIDVPGLAVLPPESPEVVLFQPEAGWKAS
jgi:1,6-anhydro-N-acetylmuramate kinase